MSDFLKASLSLSLFLVAITSCSIVASKQEVGRDAVDYDRGSISHWKADDEDVVTVAFDDKEPGRIHLSSEGGEFEGALCYLRSTGSWNFLNLSPKPEDGEERGWIWWVAKVLDDGDHVLLWRPDPEQFAKLVREGRIVGTVQEQKAEQKVVQRPDGTTDTVQVFPSLSVTIDEPNGKWVDELVAGKLGVPIDWQDPILWRRVDAKGQEVPRNGSQNQAAEQLFFCKLMFRIS